MSPPIACAIHQPNLFPRLSTLAKLYAADSWIVLDDVQFARRDYQHRARLAALHDPAAQQWLTLPVQTPDGRATRIRDVQVLHAELSRRRLVRLTQQYYGRSPHWPAIRKVLDQVLDTWNSTDRLADIAATSTWAMLRTVGWTGTIHHSRDLPARPERSQRLADLATAVGAAVYLCGTGGARYLDPEPFTDTGLTIKYLNRIQNRPADLWQSARRISALRAFALGGAADLRGMLRDVSWV